MDKRIIIIIAAVVLIAAALIIFFAVRPGGGKDITETDTNAVKIRNNTLVLAEDYMNKGDYQRALDLLDNLLIQDASDEDVRALRDRVLAARAEASAAQKLEDQKQQNDLVETLEGLGDSISNNPPVINIPAQRVDTEAEKKLLAEQIAALEEQKRLAEQRRKEEEARLAALSEAERQKADKVRKLIDEGVKKMEQANYSGARGNFDEAISLSPREAEAFAQKGESYFQEDKTNQINIRDAVEYANKAVEYDRSLWIPHNTLGKIYLETKNYSEAIKEFKEATRLNPDNAEILYELGKVQYRARAVQ